MGDIFDDLLGAARIFDWISPTVKMAGQIFGGQDELMIPQACGHTGGEISRLLRRHGVQAGLGMIVNGHFMISVPREQMAWAKTVLRRAGIAHW